MQYFPILTDTAHSLHLYSWNFQHINFELQNIGKSQQDFRHFCWRTDMLMKCHFPYNKWQRWYLPGPDKNETVNFKCMFYGNMPSELLLVFKYVFLESIISFIELKVQNRGKKWYTITDHISWVYFFHGSRTCIPPIYNTVISYIIVCSTLSHDIPWGIKFSYSVRSGCQDI